MISKSLPTLGFFNMKHTGHLLLLKSLLPLISRVRKEQWAKNACDSFLSSQFQPDVGKKMNVIETLPSPGVPTNHHHYTLGSFEKISIMLVVRKLVEESLPYRFKQVSFHEKHLKSSSEGGEMFMMLRDTGCSNSGCVWKWKGIFGGRNRIGNLIS